MRVTLLTGSYPPLPCGVGDYTAMLARALASDCAVTVITSRGASAGPDSNAEVRPLMADWSLAEKARLGREVTATRPDVVHLQYPTVGMGSSLLPVLVPSICKNIGVPLVVTLHEFRQVHRLRKAAELPMIFGARRLIVADHREHQTLAALPGARRKTSLIPIGSSLPGEVSPEDLQQAREALHPQEGEVLIGYFGFFSKTKGADVLVQALARLVEAGVPARLVVVGGGQQGRGGDLDEALAGTGLADRVYRTGFCAPNLAAAFLAACDVCLLPFRDGLSLRRSTYVAALRLGLPIITTVRNGWVPPGVEHGVNAWLVDLVDDPRTTAVSVADAVITMQRKPSIKATLASGARELSRRFSWDQIAQAHEALYEELLAGSPGGR